MALRLPGALDGPVVGLVDEVAGVPAGLVELVGADDAGGAEVAGQCLAGGSGLDHGEVGDPLGHEGGGGEGADGSGSEDDDPVVRLDLGLGDAVEGDGQGLGQRGLAQAQAVGQSEDLVLVGQRVAGERALVVTRADVAPPQAERRSPGEAGPALTAAAGGSGHDRLAHRPPGDLGADGGDGAGVLVALDGVGRAPALQHHVQVAAAHAAMGHLEQDVVGPEVRGVDVDHLQDPLLAVDGGGHGGGEGHRDTRSGRYSGWSVSHCDAARMVSSFFLLMNP